mgnify:CR=1 FL=1
MIGGGAGSFIGPVHRMAAELDGEGELAAKAKVTVVQILGGARLKVRPA